MCLFASLYVCMSRGVCECVSEYACALGGGGGGYWSLAVSVHVCCEFEGGPGG